MQLAIALKIHHLVYAQKLAIAIEVQYIFPKETQVPHQIIIEFFLQLGHMHQIDRHSFFGFLILYNYSHLPSVFINFSQPLFQVT